MLHAFSRYPRTTRPTRDQDARDRQVDGCIRAPRFPRRASRPYLPRPLLRRRTAVEPARRDVPLGGHRRRHDPPLEGGLGRRGLHPTFDQGERPDVRQAGQTLRRRMGLALGMARRARWQGDHARFAFRGQANQQPERHRGALGRRDLFHRFPRRALQRRHGGRGPAAVPRFPGRVPHLPGRREASRGDHRYGVSERARVHARRVGALRERHAPRRDPRLRHAARRRLRRDAPLSQAHR